MTESRRGASRRGLAKLLILPGVVTSTTARCTSVRVQDQQAELGTNSASPYAGFDTGYLNKNHNILASFTKVYGSTFTTQTKLTWNRLLGDQPLTGDYQWESRSPLRTGRRIDLARKGSRWAEANEEGCRGASSCRQMGLGH